jgi:hypothetical protein
LPNLLLLYSAKEMMIASLWIAMPLIWQVLELCYLAIPHSYNANAVTTAFLWIAMPLV